VLSSLIKWIESQGIDAGAIRRLPGVGDIADPDLIGSGR